MNAVSRSKNELLLIAFALLFGVVLLCGICLNTFLPERSGVVTPPTEYNSHGVNINSASSEELAKLSGIGDDKAKKIVEYRSEHGEFIWPEEITEVDGIGEKTYEKIKDSITVN